MRENGCKNRCRTVISMRKEERFRTWGFLLIDFSQEQQFPNMVLQRRVSRGFCKGQSQGQGSRTLAVPTYSSTCFSSTIYFVLYIGVLPRFCQSGRIIQSYNLLIYIYTTNLRLGDLCLLLWFCLKERKGLGHYLRLILLCLWVYNLIWIPCSGGKEKVRNTAIGLVLAGKWDFSPLPNPCGFFVFNFGFLGWWFVCLFFFFEIHKRTMWEFTLCCISRG